MSCLSSIKLSYRSLAREEAKFLLTSTLRVLVRFLLAIGDQLKDLVFICRVTPCLMQCLRQCSIFALGYFVSRGRGKRSGQSGYGRTMKFWSISGSDIPLVRESWYALDPADREKRFLFADVILFSSQVSQGYSKGFGEFFSEILLFKGVIRRQWRRGRETTSRHVAVSPKL